MVYFGDRLLHKPRPDRIGGREPNIVWDVFDSNDKLKAIINLDGSLNEKKTKKAKKRTGCRGQ